ncbi:hypothetical protein QYE76_059304 [Lolium multiflorum]|uniref:F-box domain-containing protein n=1 Tax=Lolium multiflorum TaxID=4521 RepID=A0AAD8V8F5_LOLMU|nr:hypothetical protein QYE76_059304 [Lolium multiflorum]
MEPPPAPPPALLDELLEEVFFRLPPDEPAHLVRASLVCRPWRRIIADRGFRRRYGEFHRTPLLLGFFANLARKPHSQAVFVPTSAFCPAEDNRPQWIVIDCRHGRALFAPYHWKTRGAASFDLVVWDPMTGDWHPVPLPESLDLSVGFSAAVLCTAGGCDHRGCQGGPFCVAVAFSRRQVNRASACLYSSETGEWSELTSVHHANALVKNTPSILVGDKLYFSCTTRHIFKYQLNSLGLSLLELPLASQDNGRLITMDDGGLGYAGIDGTDLILFSGETGGGGETVAWAQRRVIDLNSLLPVGALLDPAFAGGRLLNPRVNGFAEGTQVIFVGTSVCVYMVELEFGRVTKVLDHDADVVPYMSFCIPVFSAMEAASSSRRKLSWYFKCMQNSRR